MHPLDRPASPAAARGRGWCDGGSPRHWSRRGAAALGRGARAGLPVRRPPALPVLHPGRADQGGGWRSTCSSAHPTSTPDRGSRAPGRSMPRTRRCAGSPTWPACRPRPAGSSSQGGTVGNLSALVAAREAALTRRSARRPRPLGGLRHRGDPLVGQARPARGDGRRHHRGPGRRARPHDRDGAPPDPRTLPPARSDGIFAVVATAGTTNPGVVDDIAGIADVAGRARLVAACRRRVRRSGSGRAEHPPPVPWRRAGRLVHRRPPQVAVRAV